MACYVGMTTDLEERLKFWRHEIPTRGESHTIGTYYTKTRAQRAETEEAVRRGCTSGSGGDGPENATWYVYTFDY